jgi:hypothetical protein
MIFSLYLKFVVNFSFLTVFENVVPFSSGLYGFRWEICCHLNWCSPMYNESLPSRLFFDFSIEKFNYNVSCGEFLWVCPTWGSLDALDLHLYIFQQIWGTSSHYSLEYLLIFISSFLSFWDWDIQMLALLLLLHKSLRFYF